MTQSTAPAVPETHASESPALEVRNLYKFFGRRAGEAVQRLRDGATRDELAGLGTAAVIDADFDVRRGEIFVVMGLSGSGKSTLIRTLNGLLEPTSGSITVAGERISGISPKRLRDVRRRRVSMVFQHFALLPHLSVLDNAAYGLEIQGVGKEERRARALEILEARDTMTKAEIRKSYKALIKVLHPDMNGGDRSQEEQLSEVVWAWDQIKDSRSFK